MKAKYKNYTQKKQKTMNDPKAFMSSQTYYYTQFQYSKG